MRLNRRNAPLKARRNDRDMTQGDLALVLGVHRNSVYLAENGISMSPRVACRMAKLYETDPGVIWDEHAAAKAARGKLP